MSFLVFPLSLSLSFFSLIDKNNMSRKKKKKTRKARIQSNSKALLIINQVSVTIVSSISPDLISEQRHIEINSLNKHLSNY